MGAILKYPQDKENKDEITVLLLIFKTVDRYFSKASETPLGPGGHRQLPRWVSCQRRLCCDCPDPELLGGKQSLWRETWEAGGL